MFWTKTNNMSKYITLSKLLMLISLLFISSCGEHISIPIILGNLLFISQPFYGYEFHWRMLFSLLIILSFVYLFASLFIQNSRKHTLAFIINLSVLYIPVTLNSISCLDRTHWYKHLFFLYPSIFFLLFTLLTLVLLYRKSTKFVR